MRNNLLSNKSVSEKPQSLGVVLLTLALSCTKAPTSGTPTQATPAQESAALLGTSLASPFSVDSLYKLIEQYNPLEAQLQIEKNRNQALVALLQADQYSSCLTKVTIKSVELNINGEALRAIDITDEYKTTHESLGDDKMWNEANSNLAKGTDPTTGKPIGSVSPTFSISLGKSSKTGIINRLRWNYDENKEPMFVISGEKALSPTSSTVTIGDIDTLSIQKTSVAYNYSETCKDGTTTCSDTKKIYSVAEDQRYHMMKIRLLVNHLVIYETDSEHFFYNFPDPSASAAEKSHTNLLFSAGITLNSSYLEALQRENCDGL